MDDKTAYRRLCDEEAALPLFLQAWWLDATCGEEGWNVALVTKGEQVHAALPYRYRRVRGLRVLSQPPLTPFLGPWLRETGAKKANDYGRQKDLMTALIGQLPAYDHYHQNWSPAITNWLPFYWQGFRQTTGYTYALQEIADTDVIWAGLRENIRREIRRAENRAGVSVAGDASLDDFLKLNDLTFARQGRKRPYSHDYVRRLDAACAARDCRRIFIARDSQGRAHAGAYMVWNAESAYYLMGGGDPELRGSGGTSLCMWEAIRFAAGVSRRFDFEGSMIEPVERFFRAFGAEQVPYFKVSRTPSRLAAGLLAIQSRMGGR